MSSINVFFCSVVQTALDEQCSETRLHGIRRANKKVSLRRGRRAAEARVAMMDEAIEIVKRVPQDASSLNLRTT